MCVTQYRPVPRDDNDRLHMNPAADVFGLCQIRKKKMRCMMDVYGRRKTMKWRKKGGKKKLGYLLRLAAGGTAAEYVREERAFTIISLYWWWTRSSLASAIFGSCSSSVFLALSSKMGCQHALEREREGRVIDKSGASWVGNLNRTQLNHRARFKAIEREFFFLISFM